MVQDGIVRPAPLPRENPEKYGFETTPVDQGDRPVFAESLFYNHLNPQGVDPTMIAGRKRIDISISEQIMRVYQGDTLVLESYISTGLDPNGTEVGLFHVRMKFEKQDMSGFTSETGEVVGLGDENNVEGTQTANTYEVTDVPHVMYINYQAEALHGAYWHNNFGQRMSHGCINQPLDVAAFMFDFAPLGTPVNVYE
jgi:lipoprotein-anchoring transpeptidase ErfK/SrfK